MRRFGTPQAIHRSAIVYAALHRILYDRQHGRDEDAAERHGEFSIAVPD
jgi:hypothetical protein